MHITLTSASGAISECDVHLGMRILCSFTCLNSFHDSTFTLHLHVMNIVHTHLRFESTPDTIFTCDSHRVSAFQIRIYAKYRIHIWFASRERISDSNVCRIPHSHLIRIARTHVRLESTPMPYSYLIRIAQAHCVFTSTPNTVFTWNLNTGLCLHL